MQGASTTTNNTTRARRLLTGCLLLALVTLSLAYLGLRALGAFLITGDPLQKADAVVVLGGGNGQRVIEGVRLVKEGYGRWLVLTEPGEIEPGAGPGSEVLRSEAIANGLSPNLILVTEQISDSTSDEAQSVLQLMAKNDFHSVTVVTEPYHTQRTRLIFRRAFAGSGNTIRVYPVQGHSYRSDTWFLSLDGWGHTLREYLKLGLFVLRVIF